MVNRKIREFHSFYFYRKIFVPYIRIDSSIIFLSTLSTLALNWKNSPVSKIKYRRSKTRMKRRIVASYRRLMEIRAVGLGLLICPTKTFLIHNIDRIEPPAAVDFNFHTSVRRVLTHPAEWICPGAENGPADSSFRFIAPFSRRFRALSFRFPIGKCKILPSNL